MPAWTVMHRRLWSVHIEITQDYRNLTA